MSRGITEQEAAAMRATIREHLTAAQRESQRTGKPLHILVGEAHHDYRSFLSASIVVDEARRLGIGNLNLETDTLFTPAASRPVPASNLSPLETMGALFPDMRTRKIDTARGGAASSTDYGMNSQVIAQRDNAMANNIAASGNASVSLVGALHLQGISQHRALQNAVVVNINTIPPSLPINVTNTPQLQAPLAFARGGAGVFQLSSQGDARELSYGQVVHTALGKERAAPLLANLERRGLITSEEGLARFIKQIERQPTNDSNRSFYQLSLANAHRDLAALRPGSLHNTETAQRFTQIYNQNPSDTISMRAQNAPGAVRHALGIENNQTSFLDNLRSMFSGFSLPHAPASPTENPKAPLNITPPPSTQRAQPNR